jgi:NifU-like protein involved in Fe-S cluster formation
VRFQLRADADGRVSEARFKAFGCPVTIACASWATLELAGCTLEEARQLDTGRIGAGLDLRDDQMPLAELTARAIGTAVADLESKLRRAGFRIPLPVPR